ncbi:hypothetical protein chiPu_0011259 [Chiloscyllium punctatum]|uniref:Ig-like domain-containing protein n=1 Tax=Chiloscyllium punctatum TaxID=137246 RepID=A0A401SQW8_CHIPU|nr:hypothetical protein [Chiloscyllium punctatum]
MVTVTTAMPSAPTLYGLVSSCQQDDTDRTMIYGCLAMDYIPDVTRVTWKKDDEKLTDGVKIYSSVRDEKGTYTLSSQLTLTESETNCSKIYCEVQHSESNKSIAMPCPSEDSPPTLFLTVSSREDIESSKYTTVLCSIIAFHPKSISVSWLKNGLPMDSNFFTSPVCEAYGKFSATSWLNISAVEWFHSAVYTCQVTHQGLTQSRSINAPQKAPNHSTLECESGICDYLDYTVKILPPPVEQVLLDATVTLTCVVSKLGSGVLVTWTQGEETVKSEIANQPGDAPDSVTSTLVISTQAWLSGDHFDCSVNHQHLPTPARDSIRKEKVTNLLEPSVSVLLPTSEEVSEQTVVSLTCLVRGFFPREVFIKWTTNNRPVTPSNYRNTKVMAENDNTSFFMYSLLSITAEEWASGASYSCVVGHEAIPLKTISRTVDKSSGAIDGSWIEDYEDDNGNSWTTASTFITLFFLSISYSTAVTLMKVK